MNALIPTRACEGPDAPASAGAPAPAARSGERSEPLPRQLIINRDETVSSASKPNTNGSLLNDNTSYQKKAAYALHLNLADFIDTAGIDHVLEWTLTFEKKVYDYVEAQRAFHSLSRRILPKYFPGTWWRVIERHADGAWHFHLLVQVPFDVRTGFRFDSFEAAKRRAKTHGQDGVYRMLMREAAPLDHPIRALWKAIGLDLWGKPARSKNRHAGCTGLGKRAAPRRLRRYKFGRFQLCPIRTCGKAMGRYLSGYLAKGYAGRKPGEKRYRMYGCSRAASKKRMAGAQFCWVGGNARVWRKKVALVAQRFGCRDMDSLNRRFGRRWAYKLREFILALTVPHPPDLAKLSESARQEYEQAIQRQNEPLLGTIGLHAQYHALSRIHRAK